MRARAEPDRYIVIREHGASIDEQRNVEVGERLRLKQVLEELAAHLDLTPLP